MPILNEQVILRPLQKAQQLQARLNELVGECMMEHREEIIGLLVKQHTADFIDSAGNPLRTVIMKYVFDFSGNSSPFRIPGVTNMNLIGQIELTVSGEIYEFISEAITKDGQLKSEWLENWNGAPIMDLAPENKRAVWEIIKDTFKEKSLNVLAG